MASRRARPRNDQLRASPADATPILTPAVRGTYFLDHEGHAWFDELRGTSRSFALHDGAEVLAASYASLSLVGARLRYVTEPGTSSADTMLPGRATELRAGVRRGCARLANDEVWCVGVATADPLTIDAARVVFPE